jgi:hypothetical protein
MWGCLVDVTTASTGIVGRAPFIFNLETRWRWTVNVRLWPLYPPIESQQPQNRSRYGRILIAIPTTLRNMDWKYSGAFHDRMFNRKHCSALYSQIRKCILPRWGDEDFLWISLPLCRGLRAALAVHGKPCQSERRQCKDLRMASMSGSV